MIASQSAADQTYGFGNTPSKEEIAAMDFDAMPDGRGLPPGSGTPARGEQIYAARCGACHGEKLEGVKQAGGAALIGGRGTIGTPNTKKTVESFWPYATTLFDYVKRAMPFDEPGSMSDDEIYSVCAYILHRGNIIGENDVMNAETLPQVEMPNRNGFVPDPRPDVHPHR
jgi:cytochrome c